MPASPVIAVPLKEAQRALQRLRRTNRLDPTRRPQRNGDVLLVPVLAGADLDYPKVRASLPAVAARPRSLRVAAAAVLTLAEQATLKAAYDRVGDIAILEVDGALVKKAPQLARLLLQAHPAIKTVLRKGRHEGPYRTQRVMWLAGQKKRATVHTESGVRLAIEVGRVYFSPRLAEERRRIAQLVKPGESVLVMFSGAAPYPCVLSKHSPASRIVGVELNPIGHRLGLRNVAQNRCGTVELRVGDVRRVVPALGEAFDRIVMPLPQAADTFLDVALRAAQPRVVLHVYLFCRQEEIGQAGAALSANIRALGWRCRLLRAVLAGQQGPRLHRVCFDLGVSRLVPHAQGSAKPRRTSGPRRKLNKGAPIEQRTPDDRVNTR